MNNPQLYRRIKHFDVSFNFDFKIQEGRMVIEPIPGKNQVTDVFNKIFATSEFSVFASYEGLHTYRFNIGLKVGIIGLVSIVFGNIHIAFKQLAYCLVLALLLAFRIHLHLYLLRTN